MSSFQQPQKTLLFRSIVAIASKDLPRFLSPYKIV